MTHGRFERLWTDYLAGDLDGDGLDELGRLLTADPDLLLRAADWYATHRGLEFLLQPSDPGAVRDDLLGRIQADRRRFVASVREKLGGRPATPARRLWKYGLVTAAAVLLTVLAQQLIRLGPRGGPRRRPWSDRRLRRHAGEGGPGVLARRCEGNRSAGGVIPVRVDAHGRSPRCSLAPPAPRPTNRTQLSCAPSSFLRFRSAYPCSGPSIAPPGGAPGSR